MCRWLCAGLTPGVPSRHLVKTSELARAWRSCIKVPEGSHPAAARTRFVIPSGDTSSLSAELYCQNAAGIPRKLGLFKAQANGALRSCRDRLSQRKRHVPSTDGRPRLLLLISRSSFSRYCIKLCGHLKDWQVSLPRSHSAPDPVVRKHFATAARSLRACNNIQTCTTDEMGMGCLAVLIASTLLPLASLAHADVWQEAQQLLPYLQKTRR